MFNETHSLLHEFPEYKEKIHVLKKADTHFAKLLKEYESLDEKLHRIEEEIETPSDTVTEDLKKKRLHLKDELFALLKAA